MVKPAKEIGNELGVVLITSLLFMAILSVAGTTAYLVSSSEMTVSGNYKRSRQAFYDAEAGVNYVLAGVESGLADGTLVLSGSTVIVNFTAPGGFSFDPVTTFIKVSNGYRFQVTGNAGGGRTTLEVIFDRDPSMPFGVFGDKKLDLKQDSYVASYDSASNPNPMFSDNTHDADVGSNEKVLVYNGTTIYGIVGLGEAVDGTDGVLAAAGVPLIEFGSKDVDRVDPDPLGAIGGNLAMSFATVSVSNDNDSASPVIAGNAISLGSGDTMTLAEGNYYLTDVTIGSGANLIIDASAGPVNIYLSGAFRADIGSNISITGLPADFTLFSNATDNIIFIHNGAFTGTVYAPYANIEMKNGSDVFGMLWGATVDIENGGYIYFDTALKNKWQNNTVSVVSWRDTRYW